MCENREFSINIILLLLIIYYDHCVVSARSVKLRSCAVLPQYRIDAYLLSSYVGHFVIIPYKESTSLLCINDDDDGVYNIGYPYYIVRRHAKDRIVKKMFKKRERRESTD